MNETRVQSLNTGEEKELGLAAAKDELYGLIIPLGGEAIHRILHGKNVYARFSYEPITGLAVDHRVYFYAVEESKALEGEAKISRIGLQPVDEVLSYYASKLFLPEEEFRAYVHKQEERWGEKTKLMKMIVLELREAIQYTIPVRCPFPIPPEGELLTKELYTTIIEANKK